MLKLIDVVFFCAICVGIDAKSGPKTNQVANDTSNYDVFLILGFFKPLTLKFLFWNSINSF